MKNYQNLLVGLDLTEMDSVLLRYARFLVQALPKIKKVYFFHNIRFDYPEEAEALLDELERPLPELIEEEVKDKVESNFLQEGHEVDWEILIESHYSTAEQIAKTVKQKEIQLSLFGKKLSYQGAGLVSGKLLRQSAFKSDLIVLPETAPHSLNRILVPVDFSSASRKAMQAAHHVAEETKGQVSCQHVYTIPNHYFPFIPVQGFRKSMEQEAQENYKKFRNGLPEPLQGIPCEFTYARNRTTAEAIYDHAISGKKDMIAIGSHGRSAVPTVLLGSTATQVLQFEFHIPVLVVR
ncbi:MAG: universal stress protein [Bacteroidetes bacterium]|jgi:nucleotide-binding universal stress UspA family protein|nr:universal stress protein [Bacteroidota bacterium]